MCESEIVVLVDVLEAMWGREVVLEACDSGQLPKLVEVSLAGCETALQSVSGTLANISV